MILDSEEQRKNLISALEEANIKGKMAREMVKLLDTLIEAKVDESKSD